MKRLQKSSFLTKAIIMLLLLMTLATVITVPHVKADEEEVTSKSFYMMGSASASYYNNSQEPKEIGATALKELTIGDSGGLLAYVDKNTVGHGDYAFSNSTSAESTIAYDSLLNVATGDSSHTNSMYYYCRYGYLLKAIGFDDNDNDSFSLRKISGGILWFIYQLAQAIPSIFLGIINILKTLNVFQWFADGFNDALNGAEDEIGGNENIIQDSGNLMQMDNIAEEHPLKPLSDAIGETYTKLYQVGWEITIPACIVLLLVGIFLLHEQGDKRNGRIKKLIIRMMLITFGVPICSGLYSSSLDAVSNAISDNMDGASKVIASTLCDFEGWVKTNRLAVPENAVLESQGTAGTLAGEPTSSTYSNLRKTCFTINTLAGCTTSSITDVDWNKAALQKSSSSTDTASDKEKIIDLITRYMDGTTYESATFEASTKAWLSKKTKKNDTYAEILDEVLTNSLEAKQFAGTDDDNSASDEDAASERFNNTEKWNKVELNNGKKISANIWNNGGLAAKASNSTLGTTENTSLRLGKSVNIKQSDLMKSYIVSYSTKDANFTQDANGSNVNQTGGLSTMAMYNYLNSEFSKAEIKVYSTDRVSSHFTKSPHFSVNLIGGGGLSFLYWFNALVMLGAITVVGFCYSLPILFNSFKISMEIIYNMPFMMFGAVKAGVKILVLTGMLIIELVGNMFLYSIVSEFLMAIGGIVDTDYFSTYLDGTIVLGLTASTAQGTMPGTTLTIIRLTLSSVIIIGIMVQAIRVRKGFVKATQEMMEKALEKLLLDGDSTGASSSLNKPSFMGDMAKGALKGAAMGKGMQLAGGLNGKKGNQKGPSAADTVTPNGNPYAENSIDLDEKDRERIGQQDKDGLPDKGQNDGAEETGRLPGPADGTGSHALPDKSRNDSNNTDMDPSMTEKNGESSQNKEDKEMANKLKNADSLGDVDGTNENKEIDKGNDTENKQDNADSTQTTANRGEGGTKKDKNGKNEKNNDENKGKNTTQEKQAASGDNKDANAKGKQVSSSADSDNKDIDSKEEGNAGSANETTNDGTSQENEPGDVNNTEQSVDESSSKTEDTSSEESSSAQQNSEQKTASDQSEKGNTSNQTGQNQKATQNEKGEKKEKNSKKKETRNGNKAPKQSTQEKANNASAKEEPKQKGIQAVGKKAVNAVKSAAGATKQAVKNNSYGSGRVKSAIKFDKKEAMKDGVVYSRTSKAFVDQDAMGRNIREFKDVSDCFARTNAQGKGRTPEINGCKAKIKGNDMIITKKMENGGRTQFTVDRRTGTVKEQRYNTTYMEQRYTRNIWKKNKEDKNA